MKKILLSTVLSLGLVSSLSAYELNGNLGIKWTGYKTEKKAPVSGTFNKIKMNIKNSNSLSDFLKSSTVTIESASLESMNPVRNLNITSTLFSLATSKYIKGNISNVDEKNKTLTLNLSMNENVKNVPMNYEISNGKIIAKGEIDILDFDMKNSYLAFAKKCAAFHQNKSFSNVGIEFTIPFK